MVEFGWLDDDRRLVTKWEDEEATKGKKYLKKINMEVDDRNENSKTKTQKRYQCQEFDLILSAST